MEDPEVVVEKLEKETVKQETGNDEKTKEVAPRRQTRRSKK
jgi:hypothetical protein